LVNNGRNSADRVFRRFLEMGLRFLVSESIFITAFFAAEIKIVSIKPAVNAVSFWEIGTTKRIFDHDIVDVLN
jgi:hypothetical protein